MGRLRLKGAGLDHLSPSGGSVLQACEQQYVYRYGPRAMRDPSTQATALGSGFAWALETGSVTAGIREYLSNRPPVDPVFDDPAKIERDEYIARAMITHAYAAYVQRFGPGHDIEREVTYIVRLPNVGTIGAYSPRLLQVRVDGAIDGVTLVEDKLRSSSTLRPDAIENEVRQGRQLSAEIWAHRETTGQHLPISFRNLRKPDPRTLKSCPLDEIDGIVAAHFATERAVAEYTVTRTDRQLDQWLDEQISLGWRADALLAGELVPVRNTSACHAYGRTCPALAECQGVAPATPIDELIEEVLPA